MTKSAMKRKASETAQQPRATSTLKKPRRNGASEVKARSLGLKAKSAPEALRMMVPEEPANEQVTATTTTQDVSRSPGLTNDDTDVPASTPPSRQIGSPEASNGPTPGTITPKQKELWSTLLGSDPIESDTPYRAGLERLKLSEKKVAFLQRSSSDIPKRSRLIDSLKRHDSESAESDDDDEDEGEETILATHATPRGNKRKVDDAFDTRSIATGSTKSVRTFGSTAGSRMTYGETRTLLQEDPKSFEEQLEEMFPDPTPLSSQAIDEELEDSQGAMRSVYELRAAGGSQRFAEDLEALLEDIGSTAAGSTGRKRSAMCELAQKCADRDYVERMCTTGFMARMCEVAVAETDTVVLFAWTVAVALALRLGSSGVIAQGAWRALHGMERSDGSLLRLLDMDGDIVRIGKDRKMNMSRAALTALGQFKEFASTSALFRDEKEPPKSTLSPRDLSLRFMELLLRQLRKSGVRDPILDDEVVAKTIEIAGHHLDAPGIRDRCISILEFESGAGRSLPLQQVKSIVTVIDSILSMDETYQGPSDLLEVTLRLVLNLTNEEPVACTAFSTPPAKIVPKLLDSILTLFSTCNAITASSSEADLVAIDRLILTLGATINLAEFSDAARRAALAPSQSAPSATILSSLLSTFLAGRAHLAAATVDDLQAETAKQHSSFSQLQIAHGYLAVLLGNLCQSPTVLAAVRSELVAAPAPTPTRGDGGAALPSETGLRMLMRAIREFVTVYRAANGAPGDGGMGRVGDDADGGDEDGAGAVWDGMGHGRERAGRGGEDETWRAWTTRLEGVVAKLEEAETGTG